MKLCNIKWNDANKAKPKTGKDSTSEYVLLLDGDDWSDACVGWYNADGTWHNAHFTSSYDNDSNNLNVRWWAELPKLPKKITDATA